MTRMALAESLESRRLFDVVLADGLLAVYGTAGDDTIKVENPSGSAVVVTLNGQAQTFDRAAITRIKVRGFQGKDTITVSSITPAPQTAGVRVEVGGGSGDDTITTTGAAPDKYFLEGDDGNDTLTGSNATLNGGAGGDTVVLTGKGRVRNNDRMTGDTLITPRGMEITQGGPKLTFRGRKMTVVGSDAADTISITRTGPVAADGTFSLAVTLNGSTHTFTGLSVNNITIGGGAGNDTIRLAPAGTTGGGGGGGTGGGGTNTSAAFAGRSSIYGGDGNDTIVGGDGRDTIHGDAGADSIDGGAGNDSIFGGDGNDTITGGAGADGMSGDLGDDIFNNRDATLTTKHNDVVVGGPGNDSADDEFADTLIGVEVFRAATA